MSFPAVTEAELCRGFPDQVNYRLLQGVAHCWHWSRHATSDDAADQGDDDDGGGDDNRGFWTQSPPPTLLWAAMLLAVAWTAFLAALAIYAARSRLKQLYQRGRQRLAVWRQRLRYVRAGDPAFEDRVVAEGGGRQRSDFFSLAESPASEAAEEP